MWTRKEIKLRAKEVLRKSYWKAFLVSLIIAIVGGSDNKGGGSSSFNWNQHYSNTGSGFDNEGLILFLIGMAVIVIFIILIALAFRIFLGYPIEVGGRRYFSQSAQDDINMNYLGFAFEKGKYFAIVKTMLLRAIFTFLWTLLLIIPGIIKSYAYRMVPYILADNPNIGPKRAIELSNEMTRGNKFKMFILDLSFIGWYLLGLLLFFVGTLFVMPYENATKAELYVVLRKNALENGLCSKDELNLKPLI